MALTDISIHALHEESDRLGIPYDHDVVISIHALHEESDVMLRGLNRLMA